VLTLVGVTAVVAASVVCALQSSEVELFLAVDLLSVAVFVTRSSGRRLVENHA